jgi:hypothetical protein
MSRLPWNNPVQFLIHGLELWVLMAYATVLLLMKYILLFASLHILTNYSVFAPVTFSYIEYVYYPRSLPFAN